MAESSDRALLPDEACQVAAVRGQALRLREGVRTPHPRCGIALAETSGLAITPFEGP